MSLPLCETATILVQSRVEVREPSSACVVHIAEMVLEAPRIARSVKPGQFVHVALPEGGTHLLRRPLSVYKTSTEAGTITLLFQVVGEGTRLLYELAEGTELSLIGPLGQGWKHAEAQSCLIVGGGVGAAPLFLLAQELVAQGAHIEMVLGAATDDLLVCEHSFTELLGKERMYITTDDGSRGLKGFATDAVSELLKVASFDYLAACGPEPMLRKAVELAGRSGIACEVSLERRMACGIGACLSCAVDTVTGKKRACADGPVFKGKEVCW